MKKKFGYRRGMIQSHMTHLHVPHATAQNSHGGKILDRCGNDPSAGSPTETLLRLHLPLNDKV